MCSFELGKCYGNALDRDAKASGNIASDERRMGAGVARNKLHQWCVDWVGKRLGQPERQRTTQCIAKTPCVFGGYVSPLASPHQLDCATLGN